MKAPSPETKAEPFAGSVGKYQMHGKGFGDADDRPAPQILAPAVQPMRVDEIKQLRQKA